MSHDSTAAPEAAARKLSGRRRKEIVAVLLFSGGPIFESSIPLSVFGIDRQDAGVPRYRLLVCAGEEGPLRTTGGLELTAPNGLEAIARAGTVVVPAWRSITSPPPEEALDALRRAHEEGARIVGLCTGAFVLAAAGLLDGRPATTHWMYAPTLAKRYPSVHVDPRELFVDDGDVLTSAGTAAGIDLCLHIVRTDHGNEAAGALARRLVVPPRRVGRSGALSRQVFTRGDRRRPARRGRRLGAGAPPRAVRRGDAGGTRVHEQAYVRPPVPLAHRERSPAVADHAARASGAAAPGDVRLLGGRGRGPLRLPLPGGPARPLPPPAGLVPRRLPGRVPGPQAAGRASRSRTARSRCPGAPAHADRGSQGHGHPCRCQTRRHGGRGRVSPAARRPRRPRGGPARDPYVGSRASLPGQRSAP